MTDISIDTPEVALPERKSRLWAALKKDRKAQVGIIVLALFVFVVACLRLILRQQIPMTCRLT